jgi:hypothetical protein
MKAKDPAQATAASFKPEHKPKKASGTKLRTGTAKGKGKSSAPSERYAKTTPESPHDPEPDPKPQPKRGTDADFENHFQGQS